MGTFKAALAGHQLTIDYKNEYVRRLFADYVVDDDQDGIRIAVSDEEILREKKDGCIYTTSYLESLAICRKICETLLWEDVLLCHASAIEMDGKGYLFAAPSGTGKSTHAALWRESFPKKVRMINDDKPLLSIHDDAITVYGSPYAGKHLLQTNTSCEVSGIVILKQAPENKIRRLTIEEAFPKLMNQIYRVNEAEGLERTMDLVKKLAELPVWELECTISDEAVKVAYQALNGEIEAETKAEQGNGSAEEPENELINPTVEELKTEQVDQVEEEPETEQVEQVVEEQEIERHTSIEEELKAGRPVITGTKGVSMEPLLQEGVTQVLVDPVQEEPKIGDLLLFADADGNYLIHRLMDMDAHFCYTRGDNTINGEKVPKEKVLGIVSKIYKDEKELSVDDPKYLLYVRYILKGSKLRIFRKKRMVKATQLVQKCFQK